MICKIISGFMSLLLTVLGISFPAEQQCKAVFNGTFMQSWLIYDWTEEDWKNEIIYMKEAGIEYLILQDIASFYSDGTSVVNYPSRLKCFSESERPVDFIGQAFKYCKGSGIKIFIGLADYEEWWSAAGMTSEYNKMCNIMAEMEKEIYATYYAGNEEMFYGWYFTPEIDNVPTMQLSILNIAKGFNTVIDTADELNPDLPMLMSPYFTEYYTIPSVLETLPMWQVFMQTAHLRDGDIFCPQDAVGAGWVSEENLEKVWQMYSSAVSFCKNDVKLWANVENFISAREYVPFNPPATLEKEDSTAPLSRLIRQMKIASRYCDNIITFSYNHYGSPNTVNSVYHYTYLDYLKNGILECVAPCKAENLTVIDGVISWNESWDNIGIAYYIVYKNGEAVERIESGKELKYTPDGNGTYGIVCVDGAGNFSEVSYVTVK